MFLHLLMPLYKQITLTSSFAFARTGIERHKAGKALMAAHQAQQRNRGAVVPSAATSIVLLVILPSLWVSHVASTATFGSGSRRELVPHVDGPSDFDWLANLPEQLKSPLSKAEVASYVKQFKRNGSVGDLCDAGNLFCKEEAFRLYYEALLHKMDHVVKAEDVRVFFRVSELRVGQELYIADSALQMAALERNFMDVAELSRSRRVEPSKYYVIYSEIPEVPVRSFLPAELAEVIPLTNKSLSEIFKLHPSSLFAKNSMKTLQICNERVHKDGTTVMDGEAAVCTTSLEGLQTVLKSPLLLGPHNAANIRAVVTDPRLQCCSDFTGKIVEVRLEADEQQRHAICHSLMYPSAVYLCHFVPQGRLYSVTLKPSNADDEELVQAVGICHMDTRGWDPLHLAFLNVHTTPGHGEACHWLLKGSIAFVNNDAYQK